MRELSFAEVRAAGLPARVEFAFIGYRYRPLLDDVIVCVPPDREACATTLRIPQAGWLHKPGCLCSYCQSSPEEVPDEGQNHFLTWQEAS